MKNKVKKRFLFFLCLAAGLMIIALLAPYLVPNDPYETNPLVLKAPPCAKYPFGTDKFGRCILSRVLMGAQTSIFCAVLLVLITFLVGTLLGVL